MDLLLKDNNTEALDLVYEGDLGLGSALKNAVLVSLLTDAPVEKDEAQSFGKNAGGGWWGSEPVGSKLWLLDRSKINQNTLRIVEEYIFEALNWLKSERIADKIQVTAQRLGFDRICTSIKISLTNGEEFRQELEL